TRRTSSASWTRSPPRSAPTCCEPPAGVRRSAAPGRARAGPRGRDYPWRVPANPVTTEDLTAQIVERTRALEPELVEIRRDIHGPPEGARAEHRTAAVVADRRRAAGLEPQLLAGTGLYCDVLPKGVDATEARRLRRVVLRADLDALPLVETSGLPFAS